MVRSLKSALLWAVFIAGVASVLGGGVELLLLLLSEDATAREALGAASAVAALTTCVAVLLAPLAALLDGAARRLARLEGRRASLWVAPPLLFAASWSWWVMDPPQAPHPGVYIVFIVAALGGVGLCLWSLRRTDRAAPLIAAMIAATAVAADVWLAAMTYEEIHDLSVVVALAGALVVAAPWHRRLERVAPARLGLGLGLAALISLSWMVWLVDDVAPGWRLSARKEGRFVLHLTRPLWVVFDLDGDGYPRLWGIDCDDADASRHPLAGDAPGGGDANCNGVDPPARPTLADRGLRPAFGAPALSSGAVDLVVLIVVDAARFDAVDPALMPNLARWSRRGLRFDRMYASATRTLDAMPLVMRVEGRGTLARALADEGVLTSAVVSAWTPPRFDFEDLEWTPDRAAAVTSKALKKIRAAGDRPHFLWLHYYDLHDPFVSHPEITPPAAREGLPPHEDYRTSAVFLDRHLDRLFRELEADGRLARTMIVLTADHGEGLGERGIQTHGRSGYEVITRVPGLLIAPGVTPGRHAQLVTHRDLAPTILGAFGFGDAARDAERFGRSWLRLRGALDEPLHDFVVVQSTRATSGLRTSGYLGVLVEPRYKLVVGFEDRLEQLFDVRADPGERENLVFSRPEVAARMRAALAVFCDLDGYPHGGRDGHLPAR